MKRRDFLKTSVKTAAASLALPKLLLAQSKARAGKKEKNEKLDVRKYLSGRIIPRHDVVTEFIDQKKLLR